MSTQEELEKKIRDLDEGELVRFSKWCDTYRETRSVPELAQLSPEQHAELDARLDALDADPSLAVPWEGTMDEVRRIREELRAEKTVDRRA